jgi:hypothetical protein
MRAWRKQEGDLYNTLKETQPTAVDDGSITFCWHFKYLESFVSFSLCNNFDIKKSSNSSHTVHGHPKNVWNLPHLDIWSKYLLFCAFPMNLALWVCKTWLMQKALLNKFEVFLHCNIWQILRVSMTKVREEHIQNKHVRQIFYDIPRVSNMIAARQLDFIGKTVCGPPDRPTQQMLTACCDNV